MRGNDWYDTACAEDEPFSIRLLDGIRGFILHLGLIRKNECVLPHASTDNAFETVLRLR